MSPGERAECFLEGPDYLMCYHIVCSTREKIKKTKKKQQKQQDKTKTNARKCATEEALILHTKKNFKCSYLCWKRNTTSLATKSHLNGFIKLKKLLTFYQVIISSPTIVRKLFNLINKINLNSFTNTIIEEKN